MVPIELTKENFDDMCSSTGNTANTLQSIRESNESAWKISVEDEKGMPFVCYFLKQTNQADPILVFFKYDTAIDVIFQITPAKPTGLPNSEALINDFLNGNSNQIKELYFNDGGSPYSGYNLHLSSDQTCQLSRKQPLYSSTLGPFLHFEYVWIEEKFVMFKDSIPIFMLTPNGNTFIFTKISSVDKMEGLGGTLTLPENGTVFVLRHVTYP